ncbi:MAG: LamG domain-containing protein [Pirellulales bacterium]
MPRRVLTYLSIVAACGIAASAACTANAALTHRYSFTNNANDSVGGANGTVVDPLGVSFFADGNLNFTGNNGEGSDQRPFVSGAYVDLPNGIISALGTTGSFELWVTVDTNRDWAEIFSFGQSRADSGGEGISAGFGKYITLIPDTGDGANTFRLEAIQFPDGSPAFAPFGTSNVSAADGSVLPTGSKHHIVSIFDSTDTLGGANPSGTMYSYLDGALVGATPLYADFTLGSLPDVNNWLGRSQWPDALFDGLFDEFRIYNSALSASQVSANFGLGPDKLVPEPTSLTLCLLAILAVGAPRLRKEVS